MNKTLVVPVYNFDTANQALDQAGWLRGSDGMRSKAGKALTFNLVAQDTPNYTKAAQYLQQSWTKLGVKSQVSYLSRDDLQSAVSNHDYDALG